jgi:spore coat protein U-like protein
MAALERRGIRTALLLGGVLLTALLSPGRVDAGCTVSVSSGVSFGAYNVFSGTANDSTGRFTWSCDLGTTPTVRITLTKGGSSSYLPRQMKSGTNALAYNLYLTGARTSIWGDETQGTVAYYKQYPGFGSTAVTIYGRIPAGQDVAVGTYSDTITVVVNF